MTTQRPQGGGILPAQILKSLDDLVDRLNTSSFASGNANENVNINILALLIGTNEGIPLSRSYGRHNTPQQSTISDEVLSSIETIWATLPSATPPHAKAHHPKDDPPHPLLSHLGLGDHVQTSMAFYENCTLVHVHLAPVVVTLLASTSANIGAIRSTAVKFLRELLDPVRRALVDIRMEAMSGSTSDGANLDLRGVDDNVIKGYFHG